MKRFNTLLIAAVVLASHPARAAVIEAWMQTHSGPTNQSNRPIGMAFDASGNLIVARVSRDYYLTKYAAENGRLIWEKSPTGVGNFTLDSKGNVIITGSSGDFEYHECYTAKYAATDGALLWEKAPLRTRRKTLCRRHRSCSGRG